MKAYNIEGVKKNWHMEKELLKIANKETNRIKAILRPFIGEKVVIGLNDKTYQEGQLSKRIEKLTTFDGTQKIKPLTKGGKANIRFLYLHVSISSIWFEISLSFFEPGEGNCCEYHKGSYHIASFQGASYFPQNTDKGILKEVPEDHEYKIPTLAQEVNKWSRAVKAEELFNQLNGELLCCNRLNQ